MCHYAGLLSLSLMCTASVVINASRLYVAFKQHDGVDVDKQMVPNVYYYKLAPLIWSRMTSEQRNSVRTIVGEDLKTKSSSESVDATDVQDVVEHDSNSSSKGSDLEEDKYDTANVKSIPIKLVGKGEDSSDIVIKVLNENSSAVSGDTSTEEATNESTSANEVKASAQSNLKQLIQALQEDKPSPKVYKELIRMFDVIIKRDGSSGIVSKVLKQGRETTWKLQQSRIIIEGFRDLLELVCFGAGALLTKNLVASYSGSVVADILFSFYQRLGGGQNRTEDYDAWKASYTLEGQEQMLKDTMIKLSEEIDRSLLDKGNKVHVDETQKQPN